MQKDNRFVPITTSTVPGIRIFSSTSDIEVGPALELSKPAMGGFWSGHILNTIAGFVVSDEPCDERKTTALMFFPGSQCALIKKHQVAFQRQLRQRQ